MIKEQKKKEAAANFANYLKEGLLKKERNDIAMNMYFKNAEKSLSAAESLIALEQYLWVIVTSYYSMFYAANAVLLSLGYKTGKKIVHKVTSDALIVLVLDRIRKGLLEQYESIRNDALEIASVKAEETIGNYDLEMAKRSSFQYNMIEEVKKSKALTSLERAKEFLIEMRKLLTKKEMK